MGRIEVQDAVVFPDVFSRTCKGRGMNRTHEEGVEATQGVKRGAWVAKRIEQPVCDIHRAVKIDEWLDKKARARPLGDGEYGLGDSAGIGGIAQRVQCERQIDAVDIRVVVLAQRLDKGPRRCVGRDAAKHAPKANTGALENRIETCEFVEVITDSGSQVLFASHALV